MADRRSLLVLVLGVILVVWVRMMWRRERGWYNLYLLVVLICVVGWMLGLAAGVLVGYVVHLLLTAAVLSRV
jgi:hypothetical protein